MARNRPYDWPIVNEGQRLLIALGKSLRAVASEIDVTPTAVARWRKGDALPAHVQRVALESTLGIPCEAWNMAPQIGQNASVAPASSPPHTNPHQPASAPYGGNRSAGTGTNPNRPLYSDDDEGFPPYPDAPPDDAPTLEHLRHNVACIRHDLEHRALTVSARSKLRSDEQRAIALIAKLEQAEELREDRYVHNHPAWKRLRDRILAALKPYPEAARAVLDAIEHEEKPQ